jgi:hypothetical protein
LQGCAPALISFAGSGPIPKLRPFVQAYGTTYQRRRLSAPLAYKPSEIVAAIKCAKYDYLEGADLEVFESARLNSGLPPLNVRYMSSPDDSSATGGGSVHQAQVNCVATVFGLPTKLCD